MQAINIVPLVTGLTTDAQVTNQGYTYNQPGFTYNQAGVTYGGVYKVNQDDIPILTFAETIRPKITIQDTLAKVTNQGYTYNQAGFTYNQSGVDYGGIYNLFDITPIISMVKLIAPTMNIQADWRNIEIVVPQAPNHLLLETGSELLLEDNSFIILEG